MTDIHPGQDADATAPRPAVPGPSAKHAARELGAAIALDVGRGGRGMVRAWRRDPAGNAASFTLGAIIVGAVMVTSGWRPQTQAATAAETPAAIATPQPLPQDAAVAATAAIEWQQQSAVPVATDEPAPAPVTSGRLPQWLPAPVAQWTPQILAAADAHGVDPALVAVVVTIESCGNPKAVSPAGAIGLGQVMPETGAGIARNRGMAGHATDNLYNAEYNLDFAAWLLADLLSKTGGDVTRALCQYNGGGNCANLAESQRYMRWGRMYDERELPGSPTLDAWLAAGGQGLCDRAVGS